MAMTVEKLIEILKQQDQKAIIHVKNENGYIWPVSAVGIYPNVLGGVVAIK